MRVGTFGRAVMVVTVVRVETFERVGRVVGETDDTASGSEMRVLTCDVRGGRSDGVGRGVEQSEDCRPSELWNAEIKNLRINVHCTCTMYIVFTCTCTQSCTQV